VKDEYKPTEETEGQKAAKERMRTKYTEWREWWKGALEFWKKEEASIAGYCCETDDAITWMEKEIEQNEKMMKWLDDPHTIISADLFTPASPNRKTP
jgi:hypothetical protein